MVKKELHVSLIDYKNCELYMSHAAKTHFNPEKVRTINPDIKGKDIEIVF